MATKVIRPDFRCRRRQREAEQFATTTTTAVAAAAITTPLCRAGRRKGVAGETGGWWRLQTEGDRLDQKLAAVRAVRVVIAAVERVFRPRFRVRRKRIIC